MKIDQILNEPYFTMEKALALTSVDRPTMKNWLANGYVDAFVVERQRRHFSGLQLLQIALVYRLAKTMRTPPAIGSAVARAWVAHYEQYAPADLRDMWKGAAAAAAGAAPNGGRSVVDVFRTAADVRLARPSDHSEELVGIVVPTALIARVLFGKMAMDYILSTRGKRPEEAFD